MTTDEVVEGMGEPHWFVACSHTLQQVGEAASGWKWEWQAKEALEVKVSPLVRAFWEETNTDLIVACLKLCWEPTPRAIFCKREEGPVAHVVTFLDELAVWVLSLDAWDQFVWPSTAAVPRALTEAEPHGYCHGQVIDDVLCPKHVILFSDVTSLNGTVMSYVMSQCHMCIGHVTFYYKRSAYASVRGSCLLFIHSSGSTLSPETYMWLVPNVSSMSPGWSLLPSKVIIVLTLVNSTMSPAGTQVSQQDPGVPLYSLLVLLPQDGCAFRLVSVCIMLGATLS